jgi:hypothetical protein
MRELRGEYPQVIIVDKPEGNLLYYTENDLNNILVTNLNAYDLSYPEILSMPTYA